MKHSSAGTPSRTDREVPARAWRLSMLAAFAGIAAAGLAVIVDGTSRAVFASAAIILLITAFFCVGVTSLESHSGPPFDPDEPPAEPPVPQSQVTLIHDPKEAPNKAFQRTLEESRR
jgi:hypothetical protein